MERQRLKSLLLETGEGDPAAIEAALRDPQHRSLTAEEAVVAAGVVWEDRLAELQARHFGMSLDDLENVQAEAVTRVPREQALKYTLMPVRVAEGCLTVAMADPEDAVAADAVRYASGLAVTRAVATRSGIQRAIQQHYGNGGTSALQAMLQKLLAHDTVETIAFQPSLEDHPQDRAEEVEPETIIRLVGALMVEALRMRASDLHLEPHADRMRVRYRIDGRLQTVAELPARLHAACLARLKQISGMDVHERRQPQEGQSSVKIGDAGFSMAVSTLPTHHGEKIVLRVQDSRKIRVDLDALGLLPRDVDNLGHMLESSQGLLLVTGPAGSGRSSTLYSAFEHCNRPEVNLVSVESPVETVLAGVTQVAVEPEIGLNFPSALQAALRQDPDVLMISELPDRMTAELALDAAQTGHLVMSIVHGNDTVSVLTRLVKMGLPSHQVAASVSGVLAQRLVRRLCPACRTEAPAPLAAVETVSYMGATMPRVTWQSRGCRACDYLGYRGRIAVFELLTMTDRVRDLIYQERSHREVRAAARTEGMISLFEDGLEKVELGWTSLEELLRVVVVERPTGRKCGQCGRLMAPEFQVCPYCSDGSNLVCPSCHKALEFDWHTCPFCRFS
ncbi:MAG TPA: ATPase, T2SS/T4P/T4SS family, partial [Candidatus Xenobia bacterium]